MAKKGAHKQIVSSRDGGAGYGPSLLWWVFNIGYFAIGWTLHTLCSQLEVARGLFSAGEGFPGLEHLQPTWGEHARVWAWRIIVKNFAITFAWYSTWHYLLYQRRILPADKKFLQPTSDGKVKWTTGYCVERDVVLTMVGSLVASGYEIWATYLWASGTVSYDVGLYSQPLRVLYFVILASYWSDLHFWFAHRVMHSWGGEKSRTYWDPGYALYQMVHSVHHKSYNPGPWSGLAMHPVEHTVYFTRAVAFLSVHPSVFTFVNTRAMIGPAPGHHGFGELGGSYFHYLHHAKYNCNYGTSRVVPIDNLLGTYLVEEDGKKGKKEAPDTSVACIMWCLGLPYLVPLWVMQHIGVKEVHGILLIWAFLFTGVCFKLLHSSVSVLTN